MDSELQKTTPLGGVTRRRRKEKKEKFIPIEVLSKGVLFLRTNREHHSLLNMSLILKIKETLKKRDRIIFILMELVRVIHSPRLGKRVWMEGAPL